MSHDYLLPQLTELLADEYRLVFYDQRASGRSTGVLLDTSPASWELEFPHFRRTMAEASVISSEGARAIHARVPSSRLIVLAGGGHFPYIEVPQAFMAAVKAFVW